MKERLPNLTWLRTFEAAARLLNFTHAGNELGMTQAAVSLHIKSLETKLGCQLFIREPKSVSLTELGKAYAVSVRKTLTEIGTTTHGLFGSNSKKVITVKAPISTVTLWLAPLLSTFTNIHSTISIRLVSNIWADAVTDDNVDVDLRFGHGNWHGVKAEKISNETIVPVCSAKTLESITSPKCLLDNDRIQILGYENNWPRYLLAQGLHTTEDTPRYSVDTTAAAVELAIMSCGVTTILSRFANSILRSGRPIKIAGTPVPFAQSHYLVESSTHKEISPEVEIFKSWLCDCFNTET